MSTFSWLHAVLKAKLEPTTKLVCHTIGAHMAADGSGCFPSYATIALESGLSRRAVIAHVGKAAAAGLIEIDPRARKDGSASSNMYQATMPGGGAPDSPGGERSAPGGGERGAPLITNQYSNQPTDIPPKAPRRFAGFWEAWPTHERKRDRRRCEEHWQRHKLDDLADTILPALQAWKAGAEWKRDRGKYIPAPLVWLRNERWEAPPPPPPPETPASEIPF